MGSLRGSCGSPCCDSYSNKQSTDAEHGFVDSSTLDSGADHGDDGSNGNSPFPTEPISDRTCNWHGQN